MRFVVAVLVLATALTPACGGNSGSSTSGSSTSGSSTSGSNTSGSNPAAPTPQTVEETWRATKAQFVSLANSSRRVDIVAQGSTVTMVFAGSNYTFTQTESGKPQQVQTGTWSASTDVMTLRPAGVTWNIQFDMTRSGNNLTLNGGHVQFDFNSGNFEEALLNMTLVRQ
jgi:hypothetical protein